MGAFTGAAENKSYAHTHMVHRHTDTHIIIYMYTHTHAYIHTHLRRHSSARRSRYTSGCGGWRRSACSYP